MRVILDCDPGNGFPGADIDDGLALGLILASPELQLEAVTVVGGNTAVGMGIRSALRMLELAGVDVPVFAGSSGSSKMASARLVSGPTAMIVMSPACASTRRTSALAALSD